MGKFDGILLCADLDDTLLTDDKRVSDGNIGALKYFMNNGGMFTFATGRVPRGAELIREYIEPNAPMVCVNGAGIYDFQAKKFLWSMKLDNGMVDVMEYVDKNLPYAGIEASSEENVYFCKMNRIVEEHKRLEKFPDMYADYRNLPEEIMKVIFMVEEHELDGFKAAINGTDFPQRYSFIQSSPWYYELLPKGVSKGAGLTKLKELTGARFSIAMGDTENDISLMESADLGVAVANAIEPVKAAAGYVTKNDNNHDAVGEVIELLDNGGFLTVL